MIDSATGEIWIDGQDQPIRPLMKVDGFLASPLGRESRPNISVFPDELQYVLGPCSLRGVFFMLHLFFRSTKLRLVMLDYTVGPRAKTWLGRWLEERFMIRGIPAGTSKAIHDEWLRDVLGQTNELTYYPWGRVTSVYSAMREGSWIEVEYFESRV